MCAALTDLQLVEAGHPVAAGDSLRGGHLHHRAVGGAVVDVRRVEEADEGEGVAGACPRRKLI